jgi:hypothetical protein
VSQLFDIHKRPLPSFEEWLSANSDGQRGDGFEAFADLTRRTQEQPLGHLKPHEASFGRMFMGASIAAIELCNMEAVKHKRPQEEIVATLPRVLAAVCMYAIASVAKDDAPYRYFSKMISEEFRAAAKVAADALEESRNEDATQDKGSVR